MPENSEVLPFESVAVAVTTSPAGMAASVTEKLALPKLSVVTVVSPMNVSPSPKPEGSPVWLRKNSMVNVSSGVLLSLPWMVVLPPLVTTEEMSG